MDWSVEIKRAENGFVVKWWEELEDDKWDEKNQVFEELDSDGLDAAKALLHFVMEHFDIRGSKYDARKLEVEIVEQGKED